MANDGVLDKVKRYSDQRSATMRQGGYMLFMCALLWAVAASPAFKLKGLFGIDGELHNGYVGAWGHFILWVLIVIHWVRYCEALSLREAVIRDEAMSELEKPARCTDRWLMRLPYEPLPVEPKSQGVHAGLDAIVHRCRRYVSLVPGILGTVVYFEFLRKYFDFRRPDHPSEGAWELLFGVPGNAVPSMQWHTGVICPPVVINAPVQTWFGIVFGIALLWQMVSAIRMTRRATQFATEKMVVSEANSPQPPALAKDGQVMKAMLASLFALMMPVVLVSGCAPAVRVDPEAPQSTATPQAFPPDRSAVSVDFAVKLETIRRLLEEAIPKSYPFDESGDVRTYGTLSRGEITVRADGGRIVATTPVTGHAQVEKKIAGVGPSVGIDVSGSITATVEPNLNGWEVTPGLTLKADLNEANVNIPIEVSLPGPLDFLGRAVGIGGVRVTDLTINVAGLIRGKVEQLAAGAQGQAEAELVKVLKFRPQAEEAWKKLNDSYPVAAAPRTWLRFTPREARAVQFAVSGDAVSTRLGLICEVQVFVQDDNPPQVESALPELQVVADAKDLGDGVKLALPVVVPYEALNREATNALAKAPIKLPEANASVAISNVRFAPHGEGLLLAVDFHGEQGTLGTISGKLYLTGKPQYDPATQQFRVADLEYDVATKNLLLKSADWLLHRKFLDQLQAATVVTLTGELERAKEHANQALGDLKGRLPAGVSLDARVTEVRLEQNALRIFQDAVVGMFYVDGRMAVTIGP